jgi:hypothetical protein
MAYERTGYAPWSLTREAGVQSATVDGTIKVPQYGQPTIDIGFVDEKGNWQGRKSSDEQFIGITKAEGVGNGTAILVPDTNAHPSIDMTGFEDLFIAVKPSNGGNVKLDAVMGPDSESFGNLTPVDAAKRIEIAGRFDVPASLQSAFYDSAQNLTADVWNIYNLQGMLSNQKNLQIKITNDSGGNSNIEFGFMRIV